MSDLRIVTPHKHPGDCNGDGCRLCWLAENHPDYQRHWGLPVTATRNVARTQPAVKRESCRHLGAATGEMVPCQTCKGDVQIKVFACAVHGRCTPTKATDHAHCCVGCREHEPRAVPA